MKKTPTAMKISSGNKFRDRHRGDCSRAAADAANVDDGQSRENQNEQRTTAGSALHDGKNHRDGGYERARDASDGENVRQPKQNAGEKADIRTERDFDIGVKPPVNDTRLPAMANEVTTRAIATAQMKNAIGAAAPRPAATIAGKTKIPAPIVALTMLAVSAGTPRARTSFSSCACAVVAAMRQAESANDTVQRAIRRQNEIN